MGLTPLISAEWNWRVQLLIPAILSLIATALAWRWQETLPYLTERRLSPWVHTKTIQKAVESYRISPQQKQQLKALRAAGKAG